MPFGELVHHLSTQVNDGDLDSYIIVFEQSRGKSRYFIPFLVYALVCLSITSNLVTLDTLSPCYDYFCKHTCSPFLTNTIFRQHSMVETGILIHW